MRFLVLDTMHIPVPSIISPPCAELRWGVRGSREVQVVAVTKAEKEGEEVSMATTAQLGGPLPQALNIFWVKE